MVDCRKLLTCLAKETMCKSDSIEWTQRVPHAPPAQPYSVLTIQYSICLKWYHVAREGTARHGTGWVITLNWIS